MRKVTALLLILFCSLPCRVLAAQPEVAGKSALLMEVSTGRVLFEHNPHEPLAPASVTKVMTMLLIMEALETGKISWDDSVTASESAAAKGGSQVYLNVGETMTVTDMLKSIAVSSANDCACAMAEFIAGSEAAFVELMNRRAAELGMNDTHFVNCTGLDDSEEAKEHRTSARDIALMSRELLKNHPEIKKFTTIWMDSVRDGAFGLSNTNKMIRFYDGSTGLKTGFTSGAGYCLSASALRDGMELIAVVLHCGSSVDRFESAKALLSYGFANYALVDGEPPCPLSPIPVSLGEQDLVTPILRQTAPILIEKSELSRITKTLDLPEGLDAPVASGQQLGTMTVSAGEKVLAQIPIVANAPVQRLTLWQLTLKLLKSMCMTA